MFLTFRSTPWLGTKWIFSLRKLADMPRKDHQWIFTSESKVLGKNWTLSFSLCFSLSLSLKISLEWYWTKGSSQFPKLIYLHLFTEMFHKHSLQFTIYHYKLQDLHGTCRALSWLIVDGHKHFHYWPHSFMIIHDHSLQIQNFQSTCALRFASTFYYLPYMQSVPRLVIIQLPGLNVILLWLLFVSSKVFWGSQCDITNVNECWWSLLLQQEIP